MTAQLYDVTSPAAQLNAVWAKRDPALDWPGAPPNFGQPVIPQVQTVAGQLGLAGRAYLNADEAIRHDPANAARMLADCGIMECLEARQRATALLNWHIVADDPKDSHQKQMVESLTKIMSRTPRFMEMRRWMLDAIWRGRSGTATCYTTRKVGGCYQRVMCKWEPRNGDKLVFRYDDGSGLYRDGQVGIKIGALAQQKNNLNRDQIQYNENGVVYWLNDYERKLIAIHKHMVEDGDYDDPYSSGKIHGVGVRSRVYWTWYAMVECLQRALEYLDRAAFGVEMWKYPANNARAKAQTEEAAKRVVSGGRSILLVPVWPSDDPNMYAIEHYEPGLQGVDALMNVIKEYFGHKIKRYILGQTLTSEAEATGMGSGVADAHMATFADIVEYDSRNLEETITEEILRPLQLWNFPGTRDVLLQFKIDNEAPNIKEKLDALKSVWEMGLEIKDSDLADVVGISLPTEEDHKVFNPQVRQGILGMQVGGQNTPVPPGATSPNHIANALKSVLGDPVMTDGAATSNDDLRLDP